MSRQITTRSGKPFRLVLDDGTIWPHPDTFDKESVVAAYRQLLTHSWGANVSASKVRMLRRALTTDTSKGR